jgi:hypothetical protein
VLDISWGARGPEFKSRRPDQPFQLAVLVHFHNPQIGRNSVHEGTDVQPFLNSEHCIGSPSEVRYGVFARHSRTGVARLRHRFKSRRTLLLQQR